MSVGNAPLWLTVNILLTLPTTA